MSASKIKISEKFESSSSRAHNWDPMKNNNNSEPCKSALIRVKKDLMSLFTEPPPGLYVVSDEADMMLIHALVVGPMETPYEGGFFYFVLRCPNSYPIEPPWVKLMTTDAGRVRFNPNMYKNGKICLSILGTWSGPAWSPAQQIASLLISIQSLMNEKPYYNEPGFMAEKLPGDADNYSEIILHETLRVAVCGMLENECHLSMPEKLRNVMEKSFIAFYEQYVATVLGKLHLDGKHMKDPFGEERGRFNYSSIMQRLEKLQETISKRLAQREDDGSDDMSEVACVSST